MGSLSSRPDVPSPVQTIAVPVVSQSTSTTSADTGADSGRGVDTDIADAQSASEVRTQNLLQRNRGRFGTIRTGFRGLLELAGGGSSGSRKTLLGE